MQIHSELMVQCSSYMQTIQEGWGSGALYQGLFKLFDSERLILYEQCFGDSFHRSGYRSVGHE